MTPIKRALSFAVVAAIAACSQAPYPAALQGGPILSSSNTQALGTTVEVRIDTGVQFKTKAAKKTIADIHHYHLRLINETSGAVVAEGDSTDVVSFFHKVPNGTYRVNVDALDASGASIVQGGAQDSSNTVTVSAPNVTYSDGATCLKVHLKLLNATGEKVGNAIMVEDGDEWTGTPELQPGGSCPGCPTPTPTPTPPAGPINTGVIWSDDGTTLSPIGTPTSSTSSFAVLPEFATATGGFVSGKVDNDKNIVLGLMPASATYTGFSSLEFAAQVSSNYLFQFSEANNWVGSSISDPISGAIELAYQTDTVSISVEGNQAVIKKNGITKHAFSAPPSAVAYKPVIVILTGAIREVQYTSP